MATYIPEWSFKLLKPSAIEIDIIATSIAGGQSMNGIQAYSDISGGGRWSYSLKRINIFGPDSHLYWNQLRNILNGSVRPIRMPLMIDWITPAPGVLDQQDCQDIRGPLTYDVDYSDDVPHSDDTPFEDGTVVAQVVAPVSDGDGTVNILVSQSRPLVGGETFGIFHTKQRGNRAYSIKEVNSATTDGLSILYNVSIRPTWREDTTQDTDVIFYRPKVLMCLAPGQTMAWAPSRFWEFQPDVTFIEYLGDAGP